MSLMFDYDSLSRELQQECDIFVNRMMQQAKLYGSDFRVLLRACWAGGYMTARPDMRADPTGDLF